MIENDNTFLDALGADVDVLTLEACHELDALGFTILHDIIESPWLDAMRECFDTLVKAEGEDAAREHHREVGADRLANLVNKGVVWEKVWSHPLILSAARHIFKGNFKVSSLNGREAHAGGGHQPLHGDWKKPRPDFPKVHVVNSIWALDDLSLTNGSPRIVPGTHNLPKLPEDVMKDPSGPHPEEQVLECLAGTVMVFNAHTWHGGNVNQTGERRRVLHGYYTSRDDAQQQNQRELIQMDTWRRLTPAQRYLLDVDIR